METNTRHEPDQASIAHFRQQYNLPPIQPGRHRLEDSNNSTTVLRFDPPKRFSTADAPASSWDGPKHDADVQAILDGLTPQPQHTAVMPAPVSAQVAVPVPPRHVQLSDLGLKQRILDSLRKLRAAR